jgi:hypothetical protein
MWKGSVPIFRLTDETGRDIGTERLWQKHEMLIALLGGDDCAACEELERALCADAEDGAWPGWNTGLVLLPIDGSGETARIVDSLFEALAPLDVAPGTPTVAIADRFGRLCAAIDVHDADVDDVLREALGWIDLIQEQCDECGVPLEAPAEHPLADSADDGTG